MGMTVCNHCDQEKDLATTRELPDGFDYCVDCIQKTCPDVLAWMEKDGSVRETVAYPIWRLVVNSVFMSAFIVSCLVAVFIVMVLVIIAWVPFAENPGNGALDQNPDAQDLFRLFLMGIGLCWAANFFTSLLSGFIFTTWFFPRTIRIESGIIKVNLPDEVSIPLHEARLKWGSSCRDFAYCTWPFGRRGILVSIPGYYGNPIYLGKDERHERLWVGLSKLCNLPVHGMPGVVEK